MVHFFALQCRQRRSELHLLFKINNYNDLTESPKKTYIVRSKVINIQQSNN